MTTRSLIRTITGLSLAGMLFAGYLSGTKLITGTCALNESCPYFLGYPACWYGFAMFTTLFVAASLALLKKVSRTKATKVLLAVSALGMLFSGSFVIQEVLSWMTYGMPEYALGLPTCMYGMVFYILVLGYSIALCRKVCMKK